MSTVGKLTAALAAATNEVTVAAANINFDFTLIKCEAPREFEGLGSMLTKMRKFNAETGTTHVTARRLGALFEACCPPTPSLIRAYGLRVSEISAAAKDTTSLDYSDSIFSAYTGIDGTSIWAAATSSKAALHVHLLACMIARVFEAPEAVSIWMELTKERSNDIATRFESGAQVPFSLAAAAAQTPITKAQLAEWDASARAWLRTADEIKKTEHGQFRALLANITLEVSEHTSVFPSVMGAWSSALNTMESLVSGQPQAVNDGPTLLALSAWHLYPNMAVYGAHNFEFFVNDDLISPAGVLTIGLSSSERAGNRGVFWCLSLAYLRHYGKPVRTECSLREDPTRLSFPEFLLAALGSQTGRGPIQSNKACGMDFKHVICNAFEKESAIKNVSMLSRIVSDYVSGHEEEMEKGKRLIHLGRRRPQMFAYDFGDLEPPTPYVDLLERGRLFLCIQTVEMTISFLRHVISKLLAEGNFAKTDFIIQYNLDEDIDTFQQHGQGLLRIKNIQRFTADGNTQADDYGSGPETDTSDEDEGTEKLFGYTTVVPVWSSFFAGLLRHKYRESEPKHHRWFPRGYTNKLTVQDEYQHTYLVPPFTACGSSSICTSDEDGVREKYEYYCGNRNSAAVYCKSSTWANLPALKMTEEDFFLCKEAGYLSDSNLVRAISKHTTTVFTALAMVASVYQHLPDATIAVQALEKCILRAKWHTEKAISTPRIKRRWRKRAIALAIVAYFDTGSCDLLPSDIDNVMAISSGDSIHIPRQLLCDPMELPKPRHLTRLLGNFGKPGVVLLMPIQDPMMRDIDYRKIMSVTTPEFDGRPIDSFGHTSLHLALTDHHVQVLHTNASVGGASQVSVIESFISVRDAGEWVADIDILKAVDSVYFDRQSSQQACHHSASERLDLGSRVWSVESWDEILDCPCDTFVVRAHGNWLARLAVASVLSQLPQKTNFGFTICRQRDICWTCLRVETVHRTEKPLVHVYIY